MNSNSRLASLRKAIARTTREIFSLIDKRLSLVREVSEEKEKEDISVINRDVEAHLQNNVIEICSARDLDARFALRILNQLIQESVRVQMERNPVNSPPSVADIFSKARSMNNAGKHILHLEVGEPDFGPPNQARRRLMKALSRGDVGYTESQGILPLRRKIADAFNQRYSRQISADEVIVTAGGRLALFLAVSSVVQTGDEVIILEPSYPAYSRFVTEVGGRPVYLSTELEDSWEPEMSELEQQINPATKAIILNSPSNPTGKVLDESVFRRIVGLANDHDIFVLSDEVYSRFTQSHHTSILEHPNCRYVCVQSFSKTYGMTGFRLGFAISNIKTINMMAKLQGMLLTSVPEFVQYSGLGALDSEDEVKYNVEVIESRSKAMNGLLKELPVSFYPRDGGFYFFPRFQNEELDSVDFAEHLLEEKGVCIVPGTIYGRRYSSFFRIALCQEKQVLIEAVRRIGEMLG
ncbi:MAG: aminotransferase class I/II-fold pyridoxal phosphate-dependent enzyme [Candidatus Thorarchaeota archaeon]|nr:aminotransferase class I/II-fold pyridoxal phosphate-dependent enzyme [Candidatus Thorarchaeota archaeon]